MLVRLSYHSYDDQFVLFDTGVIDLQTNTQVSLSEIEDYDSFGWEQLTSQNLEAICRYCAELGIESNESSTDFRYWYSSDMNYHLELQSEESETLETTIGEINFNLQQLG